MRHPATPTRPRPPLQKRAVSEKRRSEGGQGPRQRGVPPCRRGSTSPGGGRRAWGRTGSGSEESHCSAGHRSGMGKRTAMGQKSAAFQASRGKSVWEGNGRRAIWPILTNQVATSRISTIRHSRGRGRQHIPALLWRCWSEAGGCPRPPAPPVQPLGKD